MVSAVGVDELGDRAISTLARHGVDTDPVIRDEHPTGQVLVSIDSEGQASYEFASDAAWDNFVWNETLKQLAAQTDALCFGTLAQRSGKSRDVVRRFVQETSEQCLRVLDVNLRAPYWSDETLLRSLSLANVLKCNEQELPVLARLLELQGGEESLLQQIAERYSFRMTVLTRGARGSVLCDDRGNWSRQEALETTVANTVGAGDSFTATIVLGMLQQLPLEAMHEWANRVSAFVCSQPGATPILTEELRQP